MKISGGAFSGEPEFARNLHDSRRLLLETHRLVEKLLP
jgi:hypothetical protein